MKRVWYLPTTDTDGKPLCVKVNVLGENGQWRQLHVVGQPYKGEGEIIVHARHVTQDWLAAWKKAKRMSRMRRRPVTAGRDPQDDFSPCRVAGLTEPVRSRGSVRG